MKAFVITIKDNEYSEACAVRCIDSARKLCPDLDVEIFNAITPETSYKCIYSYPRKGQSVIHRATGLALSGYATDNIPAKVACTQSHEALWKRCVEEKEPILILEHDSVFTASPSFNVIQKLLDDGDVCMINDPRRATRRGHLYHQNIVKHGAGIFPIDGVNTDAENCPDGLAGASAYIITPKAAQQAIDFIMEHGIWPNDALICKQLFSCKALYPYATKVIQSKSTTSD
jgi:GR25 family glycosyltransferase involved in LPS biosynthesis